MRLFRIIVLLAFAFVGFSCTHSDDNNVEEALTSEEDGIGADDTSTASEDEKNATMEDEGEDDNDVDAQINEVASAEIPEQTTETKEDAEAPAPAEPAATTETAQTEEVAEPLAEEKAPLPIEEDAATADYSLTQGASDSPKATEEKNPEEDLVSETETDKAVAPAKPEPSESVSVAVEKSNPEPDTSDMSGKYIIQAGDTLKLIAKNIYGTTQKWKTLQEMNGIKNANKIFVGDVINFEVNATTENFVANYNALPRSSVIVKKGDTLGKIAGQVLGRSHYWRYLWRFNEDKIKDPNRIRVKDKLTYIPFDGERKLSSRSTHAKTKSGH